MHDGTGSVVVQLESVVEVSVECVGCEFVGLPEGLSRSKEGSPRSKEGSPRSKEGSPRSKEGSPRSKEGSLIWGNVAGLGLVVAPGGMFGESGTSEPPVGG
jgi:hypothetical protein